MSFHTSTIVNLTGVARDKYIDDCEHLINTIEKRATSEIIDEFYFRYSDANCKRFVEVDISDLEEEFYDIIYEQKYGDIAPVADRLFTSHLYKEFTISFEDEHRGLIVISW